MTSTTTSTRGATKRRLVLLIAAASLATVLTTGAASPASALTFHWSGSPGNIQYEPVQAKAGYILDPGRTIAESPAYANQDQKVCITTRRLQVVYVGAFSSGSPFWKVAQDHTRCGWIPAAATSIRDNGVYFNVAPGVFSRISADVRWYLANGTEIASQFMDYNSTGDYYCFQSALRCNINTVNWGAREASVNFQ